MKILLTLGIISLSIITWIDGFAQAIDRARLDTLFDTLSASNLAIAAAIG